MKSSTKKTKPKTEKKVKKTTKTKKDVVKVDPAVVEASVNAKEKKPFNWSIIIISASFIALIVFAVVLVRYVGKYFVGEIVQSVTISVDNKNVANQEEVGNDIIGSKAPAFSLPGSVATSTQLIDLLDKPLIVVFWTTWQPAAVNQLRAFDQYLTKFEGELPFNVVFINQQEDAFLVESFIRRSGYDLDILFDESGRVGSAWLVHTVPTTYLISDGFVKEKVIGNYSVEEVVDKLLNINR